MSVRLTQYSHGAGCGCKISPEVLDHILANVGEQPDFPQLLVGNDKRDDAAVYDLGNGQSIVSTTDFFMPIVDDPINFGKIAAANAISDIYAMGGKPIMAIAILGWPIDKLPEEVAGLVVRGGREVCNEAGIPLAGGHSIDCPEPIFGLAVTGIVPTEMVKRNEGAVEGDLLYLTKPLGIGMVTTAEKKGLATPEHVEWAVNNMLTLNKPGAEFALWPEVHAMTDVTGFGLLGHLNEVCQSSKTGATVHLPSVPQLDPEVWKAYMSAKSVPGGTGRNFHSYGKNIGPMSDEARTLLCDPQTSGGLLVTVDPAFKSEFEKKCEDSFGLKIKPFGTIQARESEVAISVSESSFDD
ncbi:MAG: selenide, water dikinase SelD [Flavobacteriia bacterium]|nr:selenide, water dikinase SelD [Flavobacteriia bacterium]